MIPPIFFYLLFYYVALPESPFKEQVIDDKISIGYGLATGDVDGDGKPDILLADKKQFCWYRNGDWKKFVLAENLTAHDNVCIAARDINGDGKVEIAVGAQWNPGETTDSTQSGSVHYLVRPADPTQPWTAVTLRHEPTVHRMKWMKSGNGKYYLVVAPLHGRGNIKGAGEPVRILAYEYSTASADKWPVYLVYNGMHLTHNLELAESAETSGNGFYLAGKEGIQFINDPMGKEPALPASVGATAYSAGEVRRGKALGKLLLATIEPMHGNTLAVYNLKDSSQRQVIDESLNEGHALAMADFLGTGSDQIVAGWRLPNKDSLTGIKLYGLDPSGTVWQAQWIDRNGMACEDLQVIDLNNDGRPEIIASGRASHNVKIYWNRTR
jgi:hypothetical protein